MRRLQKVYYAAHRPQVVTLWSFDPSGRSLFNFKPWSSEVPFKIVKGSAEHEASVAGVWRWVGLQQAAMLSRWWKLPL
ncbi:hypothetical protein HW555_007551 [Spodoptera exigua]|uniref:Uncharacterized protein n=1 Tax=Spodoptera exigua TaxID=7107 RepID=A0A835GEP3_SPOEX|nr:hypothetical protein HW555_007551 [Spodoptera exigua]